MLKMINDKYDHFIKDKILGYKGDFISWLERDSNLNKLKIQQASADICNDYCKFPDVIKSQSMLDEICDNCPLNRLGVQ